MARECPRCSTRRETSGKTGTFTQTFGGITHHSRQCASRATRVGEDLAALTATRAMLSRVEQEELAQESRSQRRNDLDKRLHGIRRDIDRMIYHQAVAERKAEDTQVPKVEREAAKQSVNRIKEQGGTLLREASRLLTEREEL